MRVSYLNPWPAVLKTQRPSFDLYNTSQNSTITNHHWKFMIYPPVLGSSLIVKEGTSRLGSGIWTLDSQFSNIKDPALTCNCNSQKTKDPVKQPTLNLQFFTCTLRKCYGCLEIFQYPKLKVDLFWKSSKTWNWRFFESEIFQKLRIKGHNNIKETPNTGTHTTENLTLIGSMRIIG